MRETSRQPEVLKLVDRAYDSNTKIVGPTKGRYWRTVSINSSLRNLILDLKQNLKPIKFHALRACFATQMLANGVFAPIVMKIGGRKNPQRWTST